MKIIIAFVACLAATALAGPVFDSYAMYPSKYKYGMYGAMPYMGQMGYGGKGLMGGYGLMGYGDMGGYGMFGYGSMGGYGIFGYGGMGGYGLMGGYGMGLMGKGMTLGYGY